MRYAGMYFMAVCLCVSFSASAITGSSPSTITPLETVSPTVESAAAVTDHSLSATFSEAMLVPEVSAPGNYAVSGLGIGTPTPAKNLGQPLVRLSPLFIGQSGCARRRQSHFLLCCLLFTL